MTYFEIEGSQSFAGELDLVTFGQRLRHLRRSRGLTLSDLGDKMEIISHVHPPGSTEQFGPELADRTVRTLTYVVGDETKAVASIFAL